MAFTLKSRLPNQIPNDPGIGAELKQALDQMLVALNQVVSQGPAPSGQGIQSLSSNTIDPTTSQITSLGNRVGSVATEILWTATTTTITFNWDGNNGSQLLQILRDDGTSIGPTPNGSPVTVTGLVANTKYFFYPYWDEKLQSVRFATVPGVAVGTPAYAFTVGNLKATQQQILQGRIQLGLLLAQTGVTTPNAGSTSGTGGTGGGGAGSGGLRGKLL